MVTVRVSIPNYFFVVPPKFKGRLDLNINVHALIKRQALSELNCFFLVLMNKAVIPRKHSDNRRSLKNKPFFSELVPPLCISANTD